MRDQGNKPTYKTTPSELKQSGNMHLPKDPGDRQATWTEKPEMSNMTKTPKVALCDLKIKLNRIELDESGIMLMTKGMLDKLSTPRASGYNCEETVLYFPIVEDLLKEPKVVLINKSKELTKPAKCLMRVHPS